MGDQYADLVALLARVRTRWQALAALRAWTMAASSAAFALMLALLVARLAAPTGLTAAALWIAATLVAVSATGVWLAPLRHRATDRQVARFVEERCPELEDSFATGVMGLDHDVSSPMLPALLADASRRARDIDVNRVVGRRTLQASGARAAAVTVSLSLCLLLVAPTLGRAFRAAAFYFFPATIELAVEPGNIRLRAGGTVRVVVRLPKSDGAIVPTLSIREAGDRQWRNAGMVATANHEEFAAVFDRVQNSFTYRADAGGARSAEFAATVLHAPRVESIDLKYEFPVALRMASRLEADGGDIYGPAGTRVHLTIHTDKPVTRGQLVIDGQPAALMGQGDTLRGEITIARDGSYRVALADGDGLENAGETEYFIRALQDRPPDVRIVRPATDRQVTSIEEVPIEARADDDFGIARFDLVYAVRGGTEQVIPFSRTGAGISVEGEHVLYLEELDVEPGDFITYYARATDISRGKRSSEARSDIFFLEVKPFNEEFVAAQSQGMGSGAGNRSLDDLVQSQKDVISATWTLDRRARESQRQSADDTRAVARAQAEVRRRTLGVQAQSRRADDVRRRTRGQRSPQSAQAPPDPASRALQSMARAQQELESLKTEPALPHEMAALNELLKMQAEVRRREVQRQQASSGGGGTGAGRQAQDLSSLFDRELAREQQTNYETRASSDAQDGNGRGASDALDAIRELAKRQEALNREQEALAARQSGMSEDELRRQLERLTREQTELRQQADDLSRRSEAEDRETSDALRRAAGQMRGATSDLRRRDQASAGASGSRALEALRESEQHAQGSQPDERRRAAGEVQREARELADAQRSQSQQDRKMGAGAAGGDAARRRAAAQGKLADRAERLERAIDQVARQGTGEGATRAALNEAARELERQKLSDRMRRASPEDGESIARALDRIAERLQAGASEDEQRSRSSDQLARARELREQLADVDRRLSEERREEGERAGKETPGNGRSAGGASSGGFEEARRLLDELRQQQELQAATKDLESFNPGTSAPGTESWKQDFTRWEELRVQVAAALEKMESEAAARMRGQQDKSRLNAGKAQGVPDQYRRLVDEYYRALAAASRAGRRPPSRDD